MINKDNLTNMEIENSLLRVETDSDVTGVVYILDHKYYVPKGGLKLTEPRLIIFETTCGKYIKYSGEYLWCTNSTR